MKLAWTAALVGLPGLAIAMSGNAADVPGFAPPEKIAAAGKPLDVEREGHSAPFVGDFDGDGTRDLLVGQYHEGRLRVYRNLGSDTSPIFESYTWFVAGGEMGRVPEG